MICTLDANNYCDKHRRRHIGHAARLAIEQSDHAEAIRKTWDGSRVNFTGAVPTVKLLRSLPLAKQCIHLGQRIDLSQCRCELFICKRGGTCVHEARCTDGKGPVLCQNCGEWARKYSLVNSSTETIRLDHTNVAPGAPGLRFNSSIIESVTHDGYLFSYRTGWKGSNIYLIRMDQNFKPFGNAHHLNLNRNGCGYGREDPRLFRLSGHLHLMYIGVVGTWGPTNVLFARLNEETFQVEDKFLPYYAQRRPWEKNWQMFDVGGIIHAVYSIAPHVILRIEGDKATWAYETPTRAPWSGGALSGGASPVLHKGQWWSFFHGYTHDIRGRRVYNMGVYTFENQPPYRMTAITPDPIGIADPADTKEGQTVDAIFPCGAVYRNGQWAVSMGVADRWSELRFYDAAWIESQMAEVS